MFSAVDSLVLPVMLLLLLLSHTSVSLVKWKTLVGSACLSSVEVVGKAAGGACRVFRCRHARNDHCVVVVPAAVAVVGCDGTTGDSAAVMGAMSMTIGVLVSIGGCVVVGSTVAVSSGVSQLMDSSAASNALDMSLPFFFDFGRRLAAWRSAAMLAYVLFAGISLLDRSRRCHRPQV